MDEKRSFSIKRPSFSDRLSLTSLSMDAFPSSPLVESAQNKQWMIRVQIWPGPLGLIQSIPTTNDAATIFGTSLHASQFWRYRRKYGSDLGSGSRERICIRVDIALRCVRIDNARKDVVNWTIWCALKLCQKSSLAKLGRTVIACIWT